MVAAYDDIFKLIPEDNDNKKLEELKNAWNKLSDIDRKEVLIMMADRNKPKKPTFLDKLINACKGI